VIYVLCNTQTYGFVHLQIFRVVDVDMYRYSSSQAALQATVGITEQVPCNVLPKARTKQVP